MLVSLFRNCLPEQLFVLKFDEHSSEDLANRLSVCRLITCPTRPETSYLNLFKICHALELLHEKKIRKEVSLEGIPEDRPGLINSELQIVIEEVDLTMRNMLLLTRETSLFRLEFRNNVRIIKSVVENELSRLFNCTLLMEHKLLSYLSTRELLEQSTNLEGLYEEIAALQSYLKKYDVRGPALKYCYLRFQNTKEAEIIGKCLPELMACSGYWYDEIVGQPNFNTGRNLIKTIVNSLRDTLEKETDYSKTINVEAIHEVEMHCLQRKAIINSLMSELKRMSKIGYLSKKYSFLLAACDEYLQNEKRAADITRFNLQKALKKQEILRQQLVRDAFQDPVKSDQSPLKFRSDIFDMLKHPSYILTTDELLREHAPSIKRIWKHQYLVVYTKHILTDVTDLLVSLMEENKNRKLIIIGSDLPDFSHLRYSEILVCDSQIVPLDAKCREVLLNAEINIKNLYAPLKYFVQEQVEFPADVIQNLLMNNFDAVGPAIDWLRRQISQRLGIQRAKFRAMTDTVKLMVAHVLSSRNGLHCAALNGDLDSVCALVESGIDVNALDGGGRNALHVAAMNGPDRVEIIRLLLSAGVNRHTEDLLMEWTPVQYLDSKCRLSDPRTPILFAMMIFRNYVKRFNITISDLAAAGLHQALEAYLRKGGDINETDKYGNTAAHLAVARGDVNCLKLLVDQKINILAENKASQTAMFLAAQHGNLEIVKILLDKHVSVNDDSSAWGVEMTPLHVAARFGHLQVCKLLIENGADVNETASDGCTPLHYAAEYGSRELVKFLVDAGAKVNIQNTDLDTAINFACRSGNISSVKVLLGAGAKVTAKNCIGITPLDEAIMNQHFVVAEYIHNK